MYKIPPETNVDDMSNKQEVKNLHILRSGGTSNNLDKLSGNDGLAGTVVENLVLADHLAGVLGGVLGGAVSATGGDREKPRRRERSRNKCGMDSGRLTSMAFRRAEISQA